MWVRLMEYTKIKNINEYVSESVSPMNTPEQIFEMYSVPIYSTGHPEYLHGNEIASNKVKVRKNDVLLCKINPRINRVWIVAGESAYPCIASSEWIVIRNSEYNPEFLAWYFRSPKFKQLMTSEATGIGGSLTRAQPKAVAEYPVPVIERQEQDVITEILNKIYNIIDARRREINILDNLIKARFVEMFGDPIINPRELPVSDLGHLSELITKGASPSWQGFSYTDDATQTLFVTSENVREGYIDISLPKYIEDGFNEKQRRSVLQKGDFLINIVGASIGRAAQFTLDCKANINQAVALVRIEDKRIRDGYLLVYLNSEKAQQMYNSMKSDTGRANLSLQDISNLSILLPPVEEQITFENFVTQVDKSKAAVQKSLDETQLLFNSLMQKYFG